MHIMSETSHAASPAPESLTSAERWARWQEKGARHDARVARNMRLVASIAAVALTVGVIWASGWPR